MIKQSQLFVLIAFVLLTQINYAQIKLSTDRQIYCSGVLIHVSFSNGPGNSTDWIGIYKVGDVPGTVESILWNYVNGTQSATVGISDGIVTFPTGLNNEGDYWVGLFENDGFTLLAADTFKVLNGLPMVSTDKYVYDVGDTIKAFFINGPGNPTDWIGIYKAGDVPGPTPSTLWLYVDGTQSSSVGITDSSVTFTEGLFERGRYWAGFFENDGYTLLDSIGFSVSNISDSVAPEAPVVNTIPSTYSNLITWIDVPGEYQEQYLVYFSESPITDVTADGVFLAFNIDEKPIPHGIQVYEHSLRSANTNKDKTYYYAVVCKDFAGNISLPGFGGPTTNTAKGVPTVSITPPSPFVANGDLSEWSDAQPSFLLQSALGTATVFQEVGGDADCSAEAKVAIDNTYLYVMMDVTDDLVFQPFDLSPWEQDEPDLYIGLYNRTSNPTAYGTGTKADYQIRFDKTQVRVDAVTDCDSLIMAGTENYYNGEKFPSGYIIEARIPLVDLATKRNFGQTSTDVIDWKVGDRIPFDIGINDNDDGLVRQGIIFYSPTNKDRGYFNVASWTYTWISDDITAVNDNPSSVYTFNLAQNYPNPFNPSTQIQYSIAQAGLVSVKVFDILGRQVTDLVNKQQPSGSYTVDFNAQNLSTGVYVYRIESGLFQASKKMILIK